MDRPLDAFASSAAPLADRLAVAREIARALSAMHGRGRVHGALRPESVHVLEGGAVVIAAPGSGEVESPLARAGFDAPEVARGARPSRASDAFAAGALAYLAICGKAPFAASDPLEAIRRVLFLDPPPLRLHDPGIPLDVEAEIAALLERNPRRRRRVDELLRVLEAASAAGASTKAVAAATPTPASTASETWTATAAPSPRPSPPAPPRERERGKTPKPASATSDSRPWATDLAPRAASALRKQLPTFFAAAAALRREAPALAARVAAACLRSPRRRAGVAALAAVTLALAFMPQGDGPLARDVSELIERGDHAGAKLLLDEAARERPGDPLVEKLRGDLACARGASGECLRRYRVALAARARLREDESLRRNVRRLLGRNQSCGARRAAAELLGEIRDPAALPALEEARRSGGVFAFLCTGSSIDRAIAATRAGEPDAGRAR